MAWCRQMSQLSSNMLEMEDTRKLMAPGWQLSCLFREGCRSYGAP